MSVYKYFVTRQTEIDDGDAPRFSKATPHEITVATLATALALGMFVAAAEKFNTVAEKPANGVTATCTNAPAANRNAPPACKP